MKKLSLIVAMAALVMYSTSLAYAHSVERYRADSRNGVVFGHKTAKKFPAELLKRLPVEWLARCRTAGLTRIIS